MPENIISEVNGNNHDNHTIEKSVGKNEMLYALKSTLENAEDGFTINREEFHVKLVDEYSQKLMMMVRLEGIFEAVENGTLNECGYFFELISPCFYYTSGSYCLMQQVAITEQAFERISQFQQEEEADDLYEDILEAFATLEGNNEFQHNANLQLTLRRKVQVDLKSRRFFRNDTKLQHTLRRKIPANLKSRLIFGKRLVGGNWSYIILILYCIPSVLVEARSVNTGHDPSVTLTAGSDGEVPFKCINEDQHAPKHYTVKFEGKDHPFYIDGHIHTDGLMSPDQKERFDLTLDENDYEFSITIHIADVSVQDQGTYIFQVVIRGVIIMHREMKTVVLIYIPPSPAACFIQPSESMIKLYEVHCHSRPGNGNSSLACFQNGDKIPYQGGDNTQTVDRRVFWLMDTEKPVSCCSHDINEIDTITQTTCNQYRFPYSEQEISPTSKSKITIPPEFPLTTTPLSVEEKDKQLSSEIPSYSGCGRNDVWSLFMLPLMMLSILACI
nr:uncharacterized protein LOC129259686 [Lytechinus pictus]